MNDYNRGDVVLIRYHASDEGEPWLRPAVVVSSGTYNQGRDQAILAAVTSSFRVPTLGDTVIEEWHEAGLVAPSLVTGVLLTVAPESVERRLGTLGTQDMQALESSLRLSLGV